MDASSTDTIEAHRVRRNRWLVALAALPLLLASCAAVFTSGAVAGAMAVVGICTVVGTWRSNPKAALVPAQFRVSDGQLFIDDQAVLDRTQVVNGMIRPAKSGRVRVKLEIRGQRLAPIELEVDDVQQGRSLLRALGVDASMQRLSTRTASPIYGKPRRRDLAALLPFAVTATVVLAGLISGGGEWMGVIGGTAVGASLLTAMAMFFVPATVDVGVDGVLLSWFGRSRFVSMMNIAKVRAGEVGYGKAHRTAVTLELHDGEQIVIPVGIDAFEGGKSEALAQRIRDALESYHAGDVEPAALLRRGNRPTVEWLQSLKRLGMGAHGSHRDAAVEPDVLWRIAENASSSEEERAAAAIALSAARDDGAPKRLDAAQEATASPRLRVVFSAAERGEEDEVLVAALDALQAEQQAR